MKSNCKKSEYEEQNFEFNLPEDIFMSEEEKKKFETIPKFENALKYGLSSSFSGKLFKVQYVIQFFLKHQGIGTPLKSMPETSIPLMIMTPDKKIMSNVKSKVKYHPGWNPYDYKLKEFYLTPL